MEKQIIVIKPKSLSPKDKEKLTKAGNIVIEHESSHQILFKQQIAETEYTYTCCYSCGQRVYMTTEQLNAFKNNKRGFSCIHGHSTIFK